MAAESLMHSPPWLIAGWVMLHFLWVGSGIGLLGAAGRLLLCRASPEWRYAFALSCLLALVVTPILTCACLLQNRSAFFDRTEADDGSELKIDPSADFPITDQLPAIDSSPSRGSIAVANHRSGQASETTKHALATIARYLPWFWLAGTPLVFLTLASGLVGIERLKRRSQLVNDGAMAARCKELAAALGIARHVAVGVCERLAAPILVGFVRPMILLPPAALTGWSVEQLEMVLLHELAHIRRWDSLVNLVQRAVETVLFFHPAVWWISAWIRLEREHCCDRIVIARTGAPQAYAEALATLAFTGRAARGGAIAMAENNLVTRIRRILNLEDQSMKVSTKILGVVAALIIAGAAMIGLYAQESKRGDDPKKAPASQNEPAKDKDQKKPATTSADPTKPATKPSSSSIANFAGNVEAYEQVSLVSRIAGNVEKLGVDIGDRVKKGQVLAVLSVPDVELSVQQKRAIVEQARAEVEFANSSLAAAKAVIEGAESGVEEAKLTVRLNEAKLAYRKQQMQRFQKLFEQKTIEEKVVDEARTQVEVAQTELSGAKAKVKSAQAVVAEAKAKMVKSQTDIKVAEAKLKVADADLQKASILLQYAEIRSPIDGVVTRRNVLAGDFVAAPDGGKAQPILVVARTDRVRVVVDLPESLIGQVRVGTPAVVRIPSRKGLEFKAKISRLAATIDPNTRTFRAEADLANGEGKLLPGMFVRVAIETEK